MTLREKIIVMAYTGYCTVHGDDLNEYYKYIAEKLGRPVYSHELAGKEVQDAIHEAAKEDFIAICKKDNRGHWIKTEMHYKDDRTEYDFYQCSKCLTISAGRYGKMSYCPSCGADMREDE